jgi:hypothetical protein
MKKRFFIVISTFIVLSLVLTVPRMISALSASDNYWSGFALNEHKNQTDNSISSNYTLLNGNGYRRLILTKGVYSFDVKISTEKGNIDFALTNDKNGHNIFTRLDQSKKVNVKANITLYLRISAKGHTGNYLIQWHKIQ